MNKEQKRIPTSKVQRASRFVRTGMKVGSNYVKHYAKKALQQEVSKDDLDKANAEDIYETLSELKGSALKVAQVLSMEKHLLPTAYTDIFSMAQYKAPPLSGPLVVKTFRQYTGKSPQQLFDKFNMKSVHAASIGQVHEAYKDGKRLAIKIQYPGVADSIYSDLNMIKPFALRLMNMKEKDVKPYFEEVEARLGEEIDYTLELTRSVELSQACKHLPNLYFAEYYSEWSSERILTMDWLEGISLRQFILNNPPQEQRNKAGQALWNFYTYQLHHLLLTHADPHPGNFLVNEKAEVGVLDFGCTKQIPKDFHQTYFNLIDPVIFNDPVTLEAHFMQLDMLYPEDTPQEKAFFLGIFKKSIAMLNQPFNVAEFDFGDKEYFDELYAFMEKMMKMPEIRNSGKPRGSKHVIYINRALFGLFKLLHELQAVVVTRPILEQIREGMAPFGEWLIIRTVRSF